MTYPIGISRRFFLKVAMFSFVLKTTTTLAGHNRNLVNFNVRNCVKPEDFYQSSDGNDYTRCINAALNSAKIKGLGVYLSRHYLISKTIELSSNCTIIGGKGSSLTCDKNNPITLIKAEGCNNISIQGVNFDGNVFDILEKNYTRVIRFINCKSILLDSISAGNNADWCVSFEQCSGVLVKNINIYGGGRGLPGGRDGIHFLDCNYFTVDKATIDSGDDCIGITTENDDSYNGYIANIVGASEIGSIVICNEEKLASGGYSFHNMRDIIVENISTVKNRDPKNIVRIFKYNESSNISNITIKNVSGTAVNHGVFVSGVKGLNLTDINVSSIQQHGVYIVNSSNVVGFSVFGKANTKRFFGVDIFKCDNVKGGFTSSNTGILNSTNIQESTAVKIK
ncbi:glycosyl hydrolase family 28 protein [Serratia nevei]|uniref:glycosyl hydrolase family 28 protein n=1 Tax=Serratia TaxID=613 RepID=UPI00098B238B|nr:glycosyl hydrolase family 28 protein [Serratia marcescens]